MSVRILSSHQLMMAAAASTLACATSTTVFQLVIAHAQPAMSLHDTSHLDSAARPLPASRSQPPLPQQSVQLKPPLLVAWMTILHHQSQTLRERQQRPLLLRSCQLTLMSPQPAHHSALPLTELSTSTVNSGLSLLARLAAADPTVPSLALRALARISWLPATQIHTPSRLLTWVVASRRSAFHESALMSSQRHQHAMLARNALLPQPRTSASHTHTLVSARSVHLLASSHARLHTLLLSTIWTNAARLHDVVTAQLSHAQLRP